jgi:hypothetical protein
VRAVDITDPEWGTVKLLVAYPSERDGAWGELTPLQGVMPWCDLVAKVPAEALSHALHGWGTPLMRAVGRAPAALTRLVNRDAGECGLKSECIGWNPKKCVPSTNAPSCWEPLGDLSPEASVLVGVVVRAWAEGRYVLVAVGQEFSLS